MPHYVRRERLLGLVEEAAAAPLTLVVAPAGTGKTSLLAGWVAESTRRVAWASLDDEDMEPRRLWGTIIAALDPLAPGVGRRAAHALRGPGTPVEAVGRLLDGLDERPAPDAVLVIDDVHVTDRDGRAVESLALFLQHLPSWLHAVAATRRDLALPLDRLRARGRVGEIRFPELRFTHDEARDLLSRLAPALAEDEATAAVARADGWAAGLELAALAARSARAGNEDYAPAAGGALVQDYVLAEVLADEAPDLVEALADVAVVDRVGPSLARALTGRPDADRLLRLAQDRGLFVSRLPAAGWYEVHAAVRAALVADASVRSPDQLADRHVRAARWYEEAGEAVPALDHWLLANRPRRALRLLADQQVALYGGGHEATVAATLAAIPAEVAGADLASMIDHAWCHVTVDRHRFVELVDTVTWWAQRSAEDADPAAGPGPAGGTAVSAAGGTVSPVVGGRVTMLRAVAATVSGRAADGGRLARQAMRHMGEAWWRDPLGRFGWNLVAHDVALSERWGPAVEEVREAERALTRDPERRLAFEATRALGEALAGRPVDALRVVAGVRRAAAMADTAALRYELPLAEAVAHYELGDLGRAVPVLRSLVTGPAGTMLFCQALAAAVLVQALLDQGDVAGAREELTRAEALLAAESFGPDGRSWLARAGVLVALADDATGRARGYADQVADPFWAPVCGARVDLAAGARADAAAALEAAVPRCGRHEVVRDLLLARAGGGREAAVERVTAAIERAVGLGQLQTVAAEGAEVVQLVECAAWRAPQEWVDRLRRASAPLGGPRGATAGTVESLTARERDVLRLLAGRLTVREIATELYVSPNTLKFHLKTIYRKLGVGSRAEAADIARRMTSLARG